MGAPVTALRQKTVSWLLAFPVVYSRPPTTATDAYPSPTFTDQTRRGPAGGHCDSQPDSDEMPFLAGPRHCGQSSAPADVPSAPKQRMAQTIQRAFHCQRGHMNSTFSIF